MVIPSNIDDSHADDGDSQSGLFPSVDVQNERERSNEHFDTNSNDHLNLAVDEQLNSRKTCSQLCVLFIRFIYSNYEKQYVNIDHKTFMIPGRSLEMVKKKSQRI